MNLTVKQKECLEMMESSPIVYLTTIDSKGFPSTRAMLNLRNKAQYPHLLALYEEEKNPLTVYMTTNTSSEKIKEIAETRKACLYFCEPGSFHGITLQGTVEHVTDKEFRKKPTFSISQKSRDKARFGYALARINNRGAKATQNA